MSQEDRWLQFRPTALPGVQQAVGIDLFNQKPLVHKWKGCLQIVMEVVEDFPSSIDSNSAQVIKGFSLDLDGAGKALNSSVLEALARDELKRFVQFRIFLWEKSCWLCAFLCVVHMRFREHPQGRRYM